MKKTLFITSILALFLSSGTLAQIVSNKSFVSGIRSGWHTATLIKDGAEPNEANNLNRFYIGFFNDDKIARLLYLGKGLDYFQNGITYTDNSERIMHTVSIPLYLKLKAGPVFGLSGIAGNFKISEKFKVGNHELDPIENDKSNWFDVPFFLGAGVTISIVTIEARYHWGLIEVRNGLKSQYFQIGAAISL